MGRSTPIEIDLPSQVKLGLALRALAISTPIVLIGWAILAAVCNDSVERLFEQLGVSVLTPFSFSVAWPFVVALWVIFSILLYRWFLQLLESRLEKLR
jgi:hypothetical protein